MISSDGKSHIYPDLSVYNMEVSLSYINGLIGVSLEAEEVTISGNYVSFCLCFLLLWLSSSHVHVMITLRCIFLVFKLYVRLIVSNVRSNALVFSIETGMNMN